MADAPKKTFAQDIAERQAQHALRELRAYQMLLPPNEQMQGGVRVCRADGWNVCCQYLDGDFDLDELLAQNLISNAIGAGAANRPQMSSTSTQATPSSAATPSWLEQYLFGDPAGQVGTSERLQSEARNAAGGPGNILGNAVGAKQAVNAAVQTRTSAAVQAAARSIESGAASSIKINQYMTLYNANNKSTGRPWPRMRIRGLPTQVAMPTLGEGAKIGARGMRGGMSVADSAIKAANMGKLAATAHWSGAASFLHGWKGGGVLAIAPSAALDFYSSFEQDMSGDRHFNSNKFLVATAKSQSGNLLGWGLGGLAGVGAVAIGVTGAPVILIGLGVGFAVQAIWGWQGGSDWAASAAERALKP